MALNRLSAAIRALFADEKHRYLALGHAFYALFLIFSIIFYRERLFADGSLYFFNIVNYGEALMPHWRLTAFIPQIPALAANALNFNINATAVAFSLGYASFFYLGFIVIAYVYGKPQQGMIIPIALSLFMSHGFFWQVSEMALALIFASLLLTHIDNVVNKEKVGILDYLISFLWVTLCLFSHNAAIALIVFITIFTFIKYKTQHFASIAILLISLLIFALKIVFLKSDYESMRFMSNCSGFDSFYLIELLWYFISGKIIFSFAALFVIYKFLKQRNFTALSTISIAFIVWIISVNTAFRAVYDHFYTENLYLPLAFFISVVIAENFNELFKKARLRAAVVLLFFITFFIQLIFRSGFYSERVDFILEKSRQIADSSSFQTIISDTVICGQTGNWSLPVESLVQTSLEGKPRSLVPADVFRQVSSKYKLNENIFIISPWDTIAYDNLNGKWFDE